MPTSFRHHYVPQMLSKRFADSDGKLWYFNTPEARHGVKHVTTKGAFWRKHYNTVTLHNGEKLACAEQGFNIVETPANDLFDYILTEVRADRFPQLSEDARGLLDIFLFYQSKRSPETIEAALADFDPALELEDFARGYKMLLGEEIAEEELQALMTPEQFKRFRDFVRIMICLDPGDYVRQIFRACSLRFYIAPAGHAFVIGSNPVVPTPAQDGQASFISLPIASDVLMMYGHPLLQSGVADITVDGVKHFNEKIWAQSSALAGASEAAVKVLVDV
jgi:hypothetical protein